MTTTATPSIPSWEWTQLQQLASSGDLYGLNPIILGAMDQAESSGDPGSPNSSGYGGYFGLGAGKTYPGGSIPGADMGTNTPAEFDAEAQVAASAFNSYLQEAGGNPITAEEIYQSGSASGPTEGSEILQNLLGGGSAGGGQSSPGIGTAPASNSSSGLNANPLDLFGIPQTIGGDAASAVWSDVGPFLVKAILVIAGLGIVMLAAYKAASPGAKRAAQDAAPLADLAAA